MVSVQRFACAKGIVAFSSALQLIRIKGFDVSAVVLVEVCEPIVEKHGGFEIVGNVELQRTNRSIHGKTAVVGAVDAVLLPLVCGIICAVRIGAFE